MKKKKRACTAITTGDIIDIKVKGQDFPTMVTVRYKVDGKLYEVTESIKLKSEKIKIGFFTVGQKRIAVMGKTAVGNTARVSYDPDNPADAFITDNVGNANV